jgi:hypothetical protein
MPELCRFYGIVIKMFFRKREHNPPHFHAIYGEDFKGTVLLKYFFVYDILHYKERLILCQDMLEKRVKQE